MLEAEIVKETSPAGKPLLVAYCRCRRGTATLAGFETVFEVEVDEVVPEPEARRRLLAAWKQHRAQEHGEMDPTVETRAKPPTFAVLE